MVEGRAISQSMLADLERGFAPPRPHLIEECARVLELNRDLLYLAADIVPPEVAEELRRLTPEEREMAWEHSRKWWRTRRRRSSVSRSGHRPNKSWPRPKR
jgi:transcriptional regulator with XRE-family HTH domain